MIVTVIIMIIAAAVEDGTSHRGPGKRGRKLRGVETWRPAADVDVSFRQVDAAVVPGVMVATVPALHRNERGTAGVGRGVLEEGRGGAVVFVVVVVVVVVVVRRMMMLLLMLLLLLLTVTTALILAADE